MRVPNLCEGGECQVKIHHPWGYMNEDYEEGTLPRLEHKYPWVYVIQPDGERFCWGIYSQFTRTMQPVEAGTAATLNGARADICQMGDVLK